MSRAGAFVTGTDTGVGKTVVAAMLTLGWEATYWKPIQAGTETTTDRNCVLEWTGLPVERCWPEAYRLRLAASPHWAAQAEHREIDLEHCARLARAGAGSRPLVVEGAGGVLAPLNRRELMIDLMARLGLPVVLVARNALGGINHTLLSLESLRARRIPVLGVVLNSPPGVAPEAANAAAIRDYGQIPLLAMVPPLPEENPGRLDAAILRAAFEKHLPAWNGAEER